MEVSSQKLNRVFSGGGEVHYVLPHFQREYAWERKNWTTLLEDIISVYQVYDQANEPEHFMGALVVINDGTRNGTIPAFKLVDGQQRLTSLSILLCALAQIVEASNPTLARRIRKLLLNEDEKDVLRYKLVPTTKYNNRNSYTAILEGRENTLPDGDHIKQAFEFFRQNLRLKISQSVDPDKLYLVVVNCLHFVFIQLSQNERPYEIFESLNAKGKDLSQADLVRNYIAMRLPEKQQEAVFEAHWGKIEILLQESRIVSRDRGELTAFLRHYLTMRAGVIINFEAVYERFRDRMENDFASTPDFIQEIEQLHHFAQDYSMFLRPHEVNDPNLQHQLESLNTLEASTFYPFMLVLFDKYRQKVITKSELLIGLSYIENYLLRRYLADEPTNFINKMTPLLEREINWGKFSETFKQVLLRKHYPTDKDIRDALVSRRLYQRSQILIFILERINRHLSRHQGGYTVLSDKPSIEHIMPQTLSAEWKEHLGHDFLEIQRGYLHTLGNLTLITSDWNASLSNSSFEIKKQRLADHALALNVHYFSQPISVWNDEAIIARTNALADHALDIWQALGDPLVMPDVKGTVPKILRFMEELIEVDSWRDVIIQMVEGIIRLTTPQEFTKLAQEYTSLLSREERKRSVQLSNGWWVYHSMNANTVMSYCERLATSVSLSTPDDWSVETDDLRQEV